MTARTLEADPHAGAIFESRAAREQRSYEDALRTQRRVSKQVADSNDLEARKVFLQPNLLGDVEYQASRCDPLQPEGVIDLASRRNPWATPKSDPITDIRKSLGVHKAEVVPFRSYPDRDLPLPPKHSPRGSVRGSYEEVLSYGEKSWPVEELAAMAELPAELRALGITRVVREPGGRYRIF